MGVRSAISFFFFFLFSSFPIEKQISIFPSLYCSFPKKEYNIIRLEQIYSTTQKSPFPSTPLFFLFSSFFLDKETNPDKEEKTLN